MSTTDWIGWAVITAVNVTLLLFATRAVRRNFVLLDQCRATVADPQVSDERPAVNDDDGTCVLPPAVGRVCPECQQGKHQNCDGTAWDDAADAPGRCACPDGSHR